MIASPRNCRTIALSFLAAAFALLTCGGPTKAEPSGPCAHQKLPAAIAEQLKEKFGGWRFLNLSDLYADDQELWTQSHANECPGIAIGHFERPDDLAYAFLLVPQAKSENGFKLVVFSRATNNTPYTLKVLEHAESKDTFPPIIYRVPPGKYTGFDAAKSIRIVLDGINVEWIEKSSYIEYWLGDHYHKIWTSD